MSPKKLTSRSISTTKSVAGDATTTRPDRLRVARAYKMFVGGAFVRSESGRYFQVRDTVRADGPDAEIVNIPLGSRKDVRDAVLAAKNARTGWAARTAYNRGQILYRLAEMTESRRAELRDSLVRSGAKAKGADQEISAAIDRVVWYAGLADKLAALLASHNPVSGPHFGFTLPESMGIVGVIAPEQPVLLGLVSSILPVIVGGNTCVVLAGDADPRTAVIFCECLATSDLPAGVVNLLTGHAKELTPHIARHREVGGISAWIEDPALRRSIEQEAADGVKRVRAYSGGIADRLFDPRRGQGLGYVEPFMEFKTVWHPIGV